MYTINESRIAELKEKHGSVYLIKVDDKQAVFKKPSRQDLSYATAVSSQGKDAVKLAETILRSTLSRATRRFSTMTNTSSGLCP